MGYVAGVPAERGMGNVILEVTVTEEATGYEESTTRMLTVARTPLSIQIIPEGAVFKPGLPFDFLLVTETPDNQPRDVKVGLRITYVNAQLQEMATEERSLTTEHGVARFTLTPPDEAVALVSHTVVNRVLLCAVLGLGNEHFWRLRQDTCAVNVFDAAEDGTFTLVLLNDTCHLQQLNRDARGCRT